VIEPDRRSRTRGSLLAGAIGDALGAPVEFDGLDGIRAAHGPAGVTGLLPSGYGPPGLVTDDTQMVLFTVEALLAEGDRAEALHAAYLRWLRTQETAAPPPGTTGLAALAWLYSARAPANPCLSGLRAGRRGTLDAPANPGSKGCGTVMRSAPFGLDPRLRTPSDVTAAALAGSVLTHGHPTAGVAAAGLAVLVHHLLDGADLPDAVRRTVDHLRGLPGHEETTAALDAAVAAAADGPPTAERLVALGEGWVAEEALAMSVYCALAHPGPDGMRDALLLAVNHGGDSDSTGAITGNVLGARHGEVAVPDEWAHAVEGRDTLLDLADRLAVLGPSG
jgi:ADP-ribosylglycohydrolase